MSNWIKYRRKGGATVEPGSRVSIRKDQFAFNSHFVATANLEGMSHVVIHTDHENFRIGFKFVSSSKDEDSFVLTNDGGQGGKGKKGRSVQVAGLMRDNPWLAAIARIEDPRMRRFEPKWSSTDLLWVISLAPNFEHRVSDKSDIPHQSRGIYRYKRGDEIAYIGRGEIRSRLGSSERGDWDFETIEYSIVPDESAQVKWEAYWLDAFVAQNGKLPIYNRISGKRA
jgi:hypothetical protein